MNVFEMQHVKLKNRIVIKEDEKSSIRRILMLFGDSGEPVARRFDEKISAAGKFMDMPELSRHRSVSGICFIIGIHGDTNVTITGNRIADPGSDTPKFPGMIDHYKWLHSACGQT